ncbi:MAG TPA: protein-disulfide reductase DsbD domain-containing protein, partial [Asticcacaulis sp.]|nr:protein-disulfide reductase DsbD domain-containing protein [Asticcacaulis sp.]
MSSILRFIACLFVLACALPAYAEEGQNSGKSPHITARLIAESATVAPSGDITLALDYTAVPGWHTYWINPGDTGLPPRFIWNLPDGITTGDIRWPVPERLPSFGLVSYGYTGKQLLEMQLHNGSKLVAGDILPIRAKVNFLVCADVCIPESVDVSLDLKVGELKRGADASVIAAAKAKNKVVMFTDLTATIDIKNGVVEIGVPLFLNSQAVYIYAEQPGIISPSAPQTVKVGSKGFSISVKAAGATLPEGKLMGLLQLNDGSYVRLPLVPAPLDPAFQDLGAAPTVKAETSLSGILIAIFGAFIGGLILNLMPCVFPVLSMKLLSLARSGHDKGLAQQESLFYGLGTILTFV